MKLVSMIFVVVVACVLIANGEIYLGFMLIVFTYLTIIKLAASSVYGDFNKTAMEIKRYTRSQINIDFDYLPYHQQLAVIEERKNQGIKERKRKRAINKARAERRKHLNHPASINAAILHDVNWDDDLTSASSTNDLFESDDDFFINNTISDSDGFEMPIFNPSTGLPMLSSGCSGMGGGVDVGGNMWGETDSFDNSINDCFSSFDDSFGSFDDTSDSFASSGMDEL